MIYPIEQIQKNLLSTEHQLLYKLYEAQTKTNRLLTLLVGETKQEEAPQANDIDHLKRPQLMQLMAKLPNKPQGFHKWDTEVMRKHIKEVS